MKRSSNRRRTARGRGLAARSEDTRSQLWDLVTARFRILERRDALARRNGANRAAEGVRLRICGGVVGHAAAQANIAESSKATSRAASSSTVRLGRQGHAGLRHAREISGYWRRRTIAPRRRQVARKPPQPLVLRRQARDPGGLYPSSASTRIANCASASAGPGEAGNASPHRRDRRLQPAGANASSRAREPPADTTFIIFRKSPARAPTKSRPCARAAALSDPTYAQSSTISAPTRLDNPNVLAEGVPPPRFRGPRHGPTGEVIASRKWLVDPAESRLPSPSCSRTV